MQSTIERGARTIFSANGLVAFSAIIGAIILEPFEAGSHLGSIAGTVAEHYINPGSPDDILPLVPADAMRDALIKWGGNLVGGAGAAAAAYYLLAHKYHLTGKSIA